MTLKHSTTHKSTPPSKSSVTPINDKNTAQVQTSPPSPAERDIDAMNNLMKQVTNESSIKSSTDVMLRGIAGQIATWKNDPAKLQELSDKLLALSTSFADAVAKVA